MEVSEAISLVAVAVAADGGDAAAVDELDRRSEHLDRAVAALLDAGQADAAMRLAGHLTRFAQDKGRVSEVRALVGTVLEHAPDAGSVAERAAVFLALGELAFRQGDQREAAEATTTARDLAREAGVRRLEHGAEFNLARIAFRDGDADRIGQHADRMSALSGDDHRLLYGATHMRGWARYAAGDVEGAAALFEANLDNARRAGHRIGEGSELLNVGSLAIETGDLDRAATFLLAGLEVAVAIKSNYLLPGALTDTGRLAVLQGHVETGIRLISAGEEQYRRAGLQPDPGDDAFVDVLTRIEAALGRARLATLRSEGAGSDLECAVAEARSVLS